MAPDKTEKKYVVKGGRTILGKIFTYQEKTGMSIGDILKLPYIFFVIGSLDSVQIDYEETRKINKDEKNASKKEETAEEQMKKFANAFG